MWSMKNIYRETFHIQRTEDISFVVCLYECMGASHFSFVR